MCFAPTRSGKGVGLVIPTLLSWPHSAVIHDIKGENWQLTSGWRSRFSHCLLFNPTDPRSAKYNPLLEVRKGASEVRDVQNIADILVDPEGALERRNHWEKTSHALLVGVILHVLYAEKEKTLALVAAFLSDPSRSFERTLRVMMSTNHLGTDDEPQVHSVVAQAARELLNKSENGRINNVLRRFGSGWALLFEAERHEARDYPASKFPDPVSQMIDEERRAQFAQSDALFESGYVVTFFHLPPAETIGRAEQFLIESEGERPDLDYRDHLDTFIRQTDRAFDLLGQLMPEVEALSDEETLTYLHGSVSARRHHIRVPEVPAYLDAVLVNTPLTGGFEPMLGDRHLRVLTILGFPGSTTPGLLDQLNHLGFSYRWMTRFIPLDKAAAERVIRRYRRQWFAKRKSIAAIIKEVVTNEQSVLVDSDADNKAADADAALQELGADLVAYGYVTTTIVVCDEDPSAVREKVRAVQRVLDGRGFATIEETANAVEAWLSSLPGHVYANVRQPPVNTLNLAHLMPLAATWAGPERNTHLDGPPLLTVRTNGTTPFRLVTHIGDVGHTLIVGPTGAGKSVLLSLITLQFRRYPGAQITIFDKGGSSRTHTMPGSWRVTASSMRSKSRPKSWVSFALMPGHSIGSLPKVRARSAISRSRRPAISLRRSPPSSRCSFRACWRRPPAPMPWSRPNAWRRASRPVRASPGSSAMARRIAGAERVKAARTWTTSTSSIDSPRPLSPISTQASVCWGRMWLS